MQTRDNRKLIEKVQRENAWPATEIDDRKVLLDFAIVEQAPRANDGHGPLRLPIELEATGKLYLQFRIHSKNLLHP